jgi:hypothetical protein
MSKIDGESFISEPITPKPGTFDTAIMATGAPGVPHQFTWRKKDYTLAEIIETWKTVGPCTSGSDEMYVRRHYYRIRTTTGETMTLYCDRQPPRGRSRTKNRWVLYTMLRESES